MADIWQKVDPPPPPDSSQSIGLLLGAPLGGATIGALSVPPTGSPLSAIWYVAQSGSATWAPLPTPSPPSSAAKEGLLVSAPVGASPVGGLANRPTGVAQPNIWQNI